MSTVHELRQILSNLVNQWPGDQDDPMVMDAREYLNHTPVSEEQHHRVVKMDSPSNDDYHASVWYSL